MSDVCSVARAANELLSLERIDCFIHNAGAYAIPRNTGALGYDNVFTINFTSAYYLIKRLRDKVLGSGGRFVAVGSIAHGYSKIKPDSVDFKECKRASLVYGNAKRHLMFSLYKLFQNEGSLAVVHPGISFTNITAHYPPLLFAIIKYPMKVIFSRPEKASLSILRGVFETTDYNEWIGPSLFDVWGMPKKKRLKSAKEEEIKIIYERAEKIYAEAREFEKSLGYETKA
jgi:NAD(P)-dependent dehydrogenase (short-subunit alcohol dehydrogenase family)